MHESFMGGNHKTNGDRGVALMGWSSETYRYRQYKNALEYIREHHGNLDLKAKIEPRTDLPLLDTLIEGLRELVKEYEAVAILEPEDENDDRWFKCSECEARLSPLYWEEAPDEWTTCPSCGCRFRGEHILEEMGIHTKRCEDCGHCLSTKELRWKGNHIGQS